MERVTEQGQEVAEEAEASIGAIRPVPCVDQPAEAEG